MKYKSYSNYKDSGVEWLGEIPSEWENSKLKYHSLIYNGNSISDNEKSQYENLDRNFSVPYVSTKDINADYLSIDYENGMRISSNQTNFKIAKKGSTLLCIEGGSAGKKLGILDENVGFVNKLACIDANNLLDKKYSHYITRSSLFKYSFDLATTGLIPGVSINQLKDFEIILPPFQEQQQIADFLDKATSKIDKTIEKQTKLCELLKEKRQAVISHAVTKGLDSNVHMKDSGVEWLGEIPEHWDRSKLGFETTVKARLGWKGLKAEEYVEDGYIFLATPNIKDNEIDFKNVNYITEERYKESPEIMLKEGDVLVTKDGSTTGTTNVVRYLPKEATVNSSIAVIRPKINLNSLYLYYYFVGSYIQETIELMKGGMGVPHLFQADLRWFNILLPSLKEQQEIGIYLDKTTFKIDTLIEKSNKAIALLKEKRTALISSAVTGKIDIRDLV